MSVKKLLCPIVLAILVTGCANYFASDSGGVQPPIDKVNYLPELSFANNLAGQVDEREYDAQLTATQLEMLQSGGNKNSSALTDLSVIETLPASVWLPGTIDPNDLEAVRNATKAIEESKVPIRILAFVPVKNTNYAAATKQVVTNIQNAMEKVLTDQGAGDMDFFTGNGSLSDGVDYTYVKGFFTGTNYCRAPGNVAGPKQYGCEMTAILFDRTGTGTVVITPKWIDPSEPRAWRISDASLNIVEHGREPALNKGKFLLDVAKLLPSNYFFYIPHFTYKGKLYPPMIVDNAGAYLFAKKK
ncbi:MAG: hypothetical protein LUC43_07935 [Burkholderiales bacterium]|nr:hypothetical protein [Burkholderiales bacterium]